MNRDLHQRLVDSLYVEAMVMADEARGYFTYHGDVDRDEMPALARIAFSCESLKVTTRLMHVIAWLMAQRAWQRGEIADGAIRDPKYLLGDATPTDPEILVDFPFAACALIEASEDLYDRVARLEARMATEGSAEDQEGPARALIDRLESIF
jgi:regulator of CtrA degradation